MAKTAQMLSVAAVLALAPAAAIAAGQQDAADDVATGSDAFGNWQDAEPGRKIRITPSDLPKPNASASSSNSAGLVAQPDGAKPVVMDGFQVSRFAEDADLQQPRVIAVAPNGDVFVSDSGAGTVHVFRMGEDGSVEDQSVFASGLNQPYGIAFYPSGANPDYVYVAETGSVVRYSYESGAMKAGGQAETVVSELPTGHHWTRDIVFSAEDAVMYVSVGSGSNVARSSMDNEPPAGFVDDNPKGATWGGERWRADVLAFDPDGKNRRVLATGLRNCSGMALEPETDALWCVVNERDMLGDNLPPDYAARVSENAFYGWPWFYTGGNPDPRWSEAPRDDLAGEVTVPDVLFQPHSAPLGIGFYTGDMFPAEYRGDAFAALHGSWNRGRRTGYKVVRMIFEDGEPTGVYQDFMTGFVVDEGNVWGRPVDVTMANDGSLLISEDGNATIWRVTAAGQAKGE